MTELRFTAVIALSLLLAPFGASPVLAAPTPATASSTAAATSAPARAAPAKGVKREAARRRAKVVATSIVEPEALSALQRMGDYLRTLTTFGLKSEASLDLVTFDGQRLAVGGVAHYKVRRPNGFVVEVSTDAKKRTFYYDGKTFTIFAPELGYYATVEAPSTIAQTLDVLHQKFDISLPLEDLFRWSDPALRRSETLQSGFRVGPATIDGVATDQYAFRERNIDWQIWIQHDGQPVPRKLVIIDRTDPSYPTYTAVLTWDVDRTLTDDDFTFHPGSDAKHIRLSTVGR